MAVLLAEQLVKAGMACQFSEDREEHPLKDDWAKQSANWLHSSLEDAQKAQPPSLELHFCDLPQNPTFRLGFIFSSREDISALWQRSPAHPWSNPDCLSHRIRRSPTASQGQRKYHLMASSRQIQGLLKSEKTSKPWTKLGWYPALSSSLTTALTDCLLPASVQLSASS